MIQLQHQFEVPAPVDATWDLLTDLPRVAGCFPGASLDEVVDGSYHGGLSSRIGPITAEYRGTASFTEHDSVAHRAVIEARGRETKGSGSANALITAELKASDSGTLVDVSTELAIQGRAAQFGRSLLAEVSNTMVEEFAHRLEAMITQDQQGADSDAGSAAASAPAQLDVMRTIGIPLAKRYLPAATGMLLAGVVGLLIGRRQSRCSALGIAD